MFAGWCLLHKISAFIFAVLICFLLSTESFASPKGAVLIDSENGRVFYELDKDEKLPMASTTKIMTALIVLEEENSDEYFSVSKADVTVEGSSMGLLPGDKVTLRILAKGMLLASGNDAANAAAAAIDAMKIRDIVGTLAGDDNILVILRTNEDAEKFCDMVTSMLS